MQRNAVSPTIVLALVALASTASAQQIITAQPAQGFTAQPAQGFNPVTPYSVAYPPANYYSPGLATVVNSPEANTIRGWYRDYLGRDVGQDLPSLVNLLRGGMSPTDLQATILGSDEFYSQKGRDPQTFIRDTLQAVNWTEPNYSDIQRWTDRLNRLRGDRFALAREILLSGRQTPSASSQLGDVAPRLASAARLAVETIDFEIGGTPQGRQANLQAQSLYDAAAQLQQAALSRPNDVPNALSNADRAYQALQQTLSNPPGTAPSAASVVRRIGTMLADAHNASGGSVVYASPSYPPQGTTYPPAGTTYPPSGTTYPPAGATYPPVGAPLPQTIPSVGGYASQPLLDQIANARRATESLIQTLSSQAYQDYSYNVILRDLDTLASRLAGLDPLVRSGASRDRVALEVQAVSDSANRIRAQLDTGRLPYTARLFWQSVDSSLAILRDSVGVANIGGIVDTSTLLRPTTLHESLLPLLDQAASQLDVFLAGTSPFVYSVPDVPAIQADGRDLKNRVLLLRQQAGGGQPAAVLKQTLNSMISEYQDAFNRWNRVAATTQLYNPPHLSPIGESLNRVEQLINQALGSGDLSPQGPTRVAQDLALLNGELTEARRDLVSLSGYREQQSINLYLEQLAGYVQQVNTAISQPTMLDARRLAVGMQGVIGRMQTDVNSVNQQVAGPLTPTLRQQATDLALRVSRMGRLVDDVESQLY